MNKKYSYKDFTGKTLIGTDLKEWNDTEVIGSCFYNETPNTKVFPDGIKGVKFIKCNLDNVVVPKECTIEGGCHRLIQMQKDGEDWLLDENLNPVEPMNKNDYVKLGLDISPAAIPTSSVAVPVTASKRQQLEDALQAQIKALEDSATWR